MPEIPFPPSSRDIPLGTMVLFRRHNRVICGVKYRHAPASVESVVPVEIHLSNGGIIWDRATRPFVISLWEPLGPYQHKHVWDETQEASHRNRCGCHENDVH